MAPKITCRALFLRSQFSELFLASLGEFGQKSFAPPNVCLLLHLWLKDYILFYLKLDFTLQSSCLTQCFITFCGFVHPCHLMLHSHLPYCAFPFTLLWMYGRCDHNHRIFIVSSDNGIYGALPKVCFPSCSKMAAIFKHGLISDSAPYNVFLSFHQHMHYLKSGRKSFFTSRVMYDW